jgi:hypothetical protein
MPGRVEPRFYNFPPRLLSLRAAAYYLSCSAKYLYERSTGGKGGLPFKVIRRGKRCFFDRADLDAYVEAQKTATVEGGGKVMGNDRKQKTGPNYRAGAGADL